MAKKRENGEVSAIVVKNLSPGPRDYPLNGGAGSLYLPPKGKGVEWPEIAPEQVSDALRLAEKKGAVELIEKRAAAKEVTE